MTNTTISATCHHYFNFCIFAKWHYIHPFNIVFNPLIQLSAQITSILFLNHPINVMYTSCYKTFIKENLQCNHIHYTIFPVSLIVNVASKSQSNNSAIFLNSFSEKLSSRSLLLKLFPLYPSISAKSFIFIFRSIKRIRILEAIAIESPRFAFYKDYTVINVKLQIFL